ncbi:prepilin-type N-terminal cleavage/methylation domain-containing protein [Acetobacterium wieringae]|uniref:Prepilin-type N-terminal cleavage/methylation domain-containing protein n=1 Tax=Acetobacterium wieringae TaxID=52694 RepID=A0ABY6HFI0_9FIRM|nr:prepilin-type N-terminal cleavage/methylation domain-containing protein [Acetobacterium wieringae]UYO63060.1 prepilin-type N-terminal cleavage/methylation domain-containing protein [Acetobacterium wieringae]VUZ22750.1 Uncharacterised protein [Acetobacterium wieringae]
MKAIKKQIRKAQGFTLVEIIVVLVVLAILAAFTIPTMLGFVADAKGKAYIAEAREVYVAAQAVATEYIATTNIMDGNDRSLGDSVLHSSGLGASLGSYEVWYRHDKWNTDTSDKPKQIAQWNVSEQMYKYVAADLAPLYHVKNTSKDYTIKPPKGSNEVVWHVTVGEGDSPIADGPSRYTRTGKVTKVVYYRNGYKVTIAGNDATVEKY